MRLLLILAAAAMLAAPLNLTDDLVNRWTATQVALTELDEALNAEGRIWNAGRGQVLPRHEVRKTNKAIDRTIAALERLKRCEYRRVDE